MRKCATCGSDLWGRQSNTRTCSARCRQILYLKRRSFRNKSGDVLMSWPEKPLRGTDKPGRVV